VLILRPRQGREVGQKAGSGQSLDDNPAVGLLSRQAIVALVIAGLGLLISKTVAVSAILGGGIATLSNAVFAYWIFKRYRADQLQVLMARFYGAEVAKIGLALGLFSLAFVYVKPLNLPALFGAYLVVQVMPVLLTPRSGAVR